MVAVFSKGRVVFRTCSRCLQEKTFEEFYSGHAVCKDCFNIVAKEYRRSNAKKNGGQGERRTGNTFAIAIFVALLFQERDASVRYDPVKRTVTVSRLVEFLVNVLGRDLQSAHSVTSGFRTAIQFLKSAGIVTDYKLSKGMAPFVRYIPRAEDPLNPDRISLPEYTATIKFAEDAFSVRTRR